MEKNIGAVMIIFGGSGDLAHRKLYPALFALYQKGIIKDHFAVIGTARRPWTHEYLREQVQSAISETYDHYDQQAAADFASHFYYQSHDVTNFEHYVTLKNLAQQLDEQYGAGGNRLFYMAMAPAFFGTIATHIHSENLIGSGFNRIVVEKPFGRSLETAAELNDELRLSFKEDQIFRIDHYLGKEMVQNLLPLRFANLVINALWDKDHISSIQVTLAEKLGVETRGAYYETSGALRDMVQNHIFQLVTLLAMEKPTEISDVAIHASKQKLLASLVMPDQDYVDRHILLGQYNSYRQEDNVADDSEVETFASGMMKFKQGPLTGVPIYFRTGKKMVDKISRIDVIFKGDNLYHAQADRLRIELDPENKITLSINGKKINESALRNETLEFAFTDQENDQIQDGYATLLGDVFQNNSINFTRWEELAQFWKYIDQVKKFNRKLATYPEGGFGPAESDQIFEADEKWING